MNRIIYYTGRAIQVFALILMPSAIWVGQFGHNERGMIIIFSASAALFFVGWLIAQVRL